MKIERKSQHDYEVNVSVFVMRLLKLFLWRRSSMRYIRPVAPLVLLVLCQLPLSLSLSTASHYPPLLSSYIEINTPPGQVFGSFSVCVFCLLNERFEQMATLKLVGTIDLIIGYSFCNTMQQICYQINNDLFFMSKFLIK